MMPSPHSHRCRAFPALFVSLLVACSWITAWAQTTTRTFDIPAGKAEATLKQFADQAGTQFFYAADKVKGVSTNAIKGEMAASDALDAMLARTELVVVKDAKSGALTVNRATGPNVLTAEQTEAATQKKSDMSENGSLVLDKYEVTGLKIDGLNNKSLFRAEEDASLPYNVITRDEIDMMGVATMEELGRNLIENTSYGDGSQTPVGNTGFTQGPTITSSSVNLRGFGSGQTAVLINGRLLGAGTVTGGGADISRFPLDTIERIEILPASAAAIYGGGAIGGAMNIILRKTDSRTLSTYFGTSTQGGGTEYNATLFEGRYFNAGRTKLTVSLTFSKREAVTAAQRDFLSRAVEKYGPDTPFKNTNGTSRFETLTLPALAGTPGTILINSATGGLKIPGNLTARYAAIPQGLTFDATRLLTPASFNDTAGVADLEDRFGRSVVYTPQENFAFQMQLEHELFKDKLSFYSEMYLGHQRQIYSYPQLLNLSLTSTHPFNPFRTGVTPGFVGVPVTLIFDTPDIPDPSNLQTRHDARLTVGLKGKLWGDWEWTLDGSSQYARSHSDGKLPTNDLGVFLTRFGVGDSPAGTANLAPTSLAARWALYNPFADHVANPISAATVASLFPYSRINGYLNANAQVALRLLGTVRDLPTGPWRMSTGRDVRLNDNYGTQSYTDAPDLFAMTGAFTTSQAKSETPSSETTQSTYVETTFPVFGQRWKPLSGRSSRSGKTALFGIDTAEIGASRRWNLTNHARNTTTNTLSGSLTLGLGVTLRASLTEGFAPTTAVNLAEPLIETNRTLTVTDPFRGGVAKSTVIPTYISGGNPNLRTESGRSKSFGMILRPRFITGFNLTVNYFETTRRDTIATPASADIFNFPNDYVGRLERAAPDATDLANGYLGAITKLDISRINLASVWQNGFDVRGSYLLPLPKDFGRFTLSVAATNFQHYRTRVRPSSPQVDFAGVQGSPLRYKGNSTLAWSKNRWLASVTMKYTDSYSASTTTPTLATPTATGIDGDKIPSYSTFDLQVGYRFPVGSMGTTGWGRLLSGSDIRIGASNILDRIPPLFSDSSGYYSRYADPRMRFVYIKIVKSL